LLSESANLFESFRRVARSCEAKTFAYSGAQGESRSLTFGAALFLRRPPLSQQQRQQRYTQTLRKTTACLPGLDKKLHR